MHKLQLFHPNFSIWLFCHFFCKFGLTFYSKPHTFIMIIIPVHIMHLFVMIPLNFINSFIFLFLEFVTWLLILMPIPGLQTYPAEIMSASTWILSTRHVVASLVLFDALVANWALFRVDYDPIYILSFGIVFDHPLRCCFAVCWQMILIIAHLAVLLVALACHN